MADMMRALILATTILAAPAYAWNNVGHKVVAEIAWRQLTPEQRQTIVDTLRHHPRFDTDFAGKMDDGTVNGDKSVQDHWVFLQAATWPDEIHTNREYDRPSWHYVDLPLYLNPSDRDALANKLRVNL